MKLQVKFLGIAIIAVILSVYGCMPDAMPARTEEWITITYKDSEGNILIDTVDNPSTINYNDIVVSRVLPDGTIREFRGDSLQRIFLKNMVHYHPTACVLITNGWLSDSEAVNKHLANKKENGDYSGELSEVTTYIKLSDELPIDTIKVEITHLNKRYKAYRGGHGYTKVFLNGSLVHERTFDDVCNAKKACYLTITK